MTNLRKEVKSIAGATVELYKHRLSLVKKREELEDDITLYNNKLKELLKDSLKHITKKYNGFRFDIHDTSISIGMQFTRGNKKNNVFSLDACESSLSSILNSEKAFESFIKRTERNIRWITKIAKFKMKMEVPNIYILTKNRYFR